MDLVPESDLEPIDCAYLRTSTVCCDFTFLKRELTVLELHDFAEHYLQVAPESLDILQWNGLHRCIYLRMKGYVMAKHLVMLHNKRHVYPPGRTGARVVLTLLDMPTVVMVFDLSELVSDEEVRDSLDRYGVVLSIGRSRWGEGVTYAGVASGHRLVRMVIRKPIPPTLTIGNEKSSILYSEQQRYFPRRGGWLTGAFVRGWHRLGRLFRRL